MSNSRGTHISEWPRLPKDPFSKEHHTYRYAFNPVGFFLLASNGPDYDVDIELSSILESATNAVNLTGAVDYYSYDPTNGLVSSGDIMRLDYLDSTIRSNDPFQ